MRKRVRAIVVVVVSASLLSATLAAPALAQDDSEPIRWEDFVDGGIANEDTDAEPVPLPGPDEVEQYAEMFDVTVREATRRLRRQERLSAIGERLQLLESERFAGLHFEHEPEFKLVLNLTGDERAKRTTRRIVNRQRNEIEIRTGRDHTYADLLSVASEMRRSTEISIGEVTATGVSIAENSVRVVMPPAPSFGLAGADGVIAARSQAEAETATKAKMSRLAGEMSIIWDTAPPMQDESVTGGRKVTGGLSNALCTSAFTVKWTTNGVHERGVLTAGHCWPGLNSNNPVPYLAQQGNVMNATRVEVVFDTTTDVALMNVPGSQRKVKHKFWNGKHMKNVGGIYLPNEGAVVCKHGKGSQGTRKNSCGVVTDLTYGPACGGNISCCNTTTQCPDVFVEYRGPELFSCGGDSGGPIYQIGTPPKAVGIHKGTTGTNGGGPWPCDTPVWNFASGSGRSFYSPLLPALNRLSNVTGDNVQLCTTTNPCS